MIYIYFNATAQNIKMTLSPILYNVNTFKDKNVSLELILGEHVRYFMKYAKMGEGDKMIIEIVGAGSEVISREIKLPASMKEISRNIMELSDRCISESNKEKEK